ncbi:serine hydrolase domain-containing protein [Tenacibaculum agarivorans]|uniref:serine hydrolase domain-containing protein n=1 Tax=Tenacibaculum agarivorans TaxID=1908389 RepID=UPI00094BA9F3|nr:serine hydrolase domain-containing protein [Tenacibaculum agarivorans]
MKILLKITFLNLILMSCSLGKKENNLTTIKNENIDSLFWYSNVYLTELTRLNKFNGVVLLKKKGKVVLKKSFNMTTDTNAKIYVTNDSQFDIRSISKLFAKASIIVLERKGKLKKEDNLIKYVPSFPNGHKITIEHLMSNTSGLPREFSQTNKANILLTSDDVIYYASKEKLEFEPGKQELYSNVGFQLLYYIIEQVTHKSYASFIKDTFFTPLKMNSSGDNFDRELKYLSNYAYGHFWNEDKRLQCEEHLPEDDMRMGNFYSTVNDLSNFLLSLEDNKFRSLRHDKIIAHAGGTRGKRAYVERDFKNDHTIVFLANYDGIPFEQLVKDLQNILRGKKVVMPKAVDRKSVFVAESILKKYIGTYDFVDIGHLLITLKLDKGNLYLYQKEKNKGMLYSENDTIFFHDKNSDESLQFIKNSSGSFDVLMDFQGIQWRGIKVKNTLK